MISVRLNNLILKYQRFTPSVCKDKGIRKVEFVAKISLQMVAEFFQFLKLKSTIMLEFTKPNSGTFQN